MFWPKDHLFNCFRQLMLFCWFASAGALIFTMASQPQVEENLLACNNQTSAVQLLNNLACDSRARAKEFTLSKKQCFVNVLCWSLNVCIVASMLIDCFKVRFLRKWFSFEYALSAVYLAAFHGWLQLNEIEFKFTVPYYCYLGLVAFQSLISLIYEHAYYDRFLVYDDFVDPDLWNFDRKIISYSSIKMVYMCAFLTANKLPQSRWAALAYQLYKHLLICVAQLSIFTIIWYFIDLDCERLLYGERLALCCSGLLLFVLIVIWKRDHHQPKVTYIFLSCIFFSLIINLLQKVVAADQLYNLQTYLIVLIGVMLSAILGLNFLRSFNQHRAYRALFERDFRKLVFSVIEMCRNKEHFMLKYQFKIRYKCVLCGNLSVDLVCSSCHVALFSKK